MKNYLFCEEKILAIILQLCGCFFCVQNENVINFITRLIEITTDLTEVGMENILKWNVKN